MNSQSDEIKEILLSSDYPRLESISIAQINKLLKSTFGANFQCQTHREAQRLIKSVTAWTRRHPADINTYIENDTWKGSSVDVYTFQELIAKEIGRPTNRKKKSTVTKMLLDMLRLFSSPDELSAQSIFEKNKVRNFIASSKLEGIILENN